MVLNSCPEAEIRNNPTAKTKNTNLVPSTEIKFKSVASIWIGKIKCHLAYDLIIIQHSNALC